MPFEILLRSFLSANKSPWDIVHCRFCAIMFCHFDKTCGGQTDRANGHSTYCTSIVSHGKMFFMAMNVDQWSDSEVGKSSYRAVPGKCRS